MSVMSAREKATTFKLTDTGLLLRANSVREQGRVRFWGAEFEHPEAGNHAHHLNDTLFEAKNDSTIPRGSGDCSCQLCNHSCDCSECDRSSRFTSCDNRGLNEVTTKPTNRDWGHHLNDYIEALGETGLSPEDFRYWCGDCEDTDCGCDEDYSEDLSNWGFHTHIDARDLNFREVASVVRLGTAIMRNFPEVFGSDDDEYNHHHQNEEELHELATKGDWRGSRPSVNPSGVIRYLSLEESDRQDPYEYPSSSQKATIEFRTFRYTDDPKLHSARVATARSIVDYVKSGKPLFYLIRERNFERVLEALEINRH